MDSTPNDMTPQEAARLLVWLVESGADEIVLDLPVNRFAEAVPAKAQPKPAIAPAVPARAPQTPIAQDAAERAAQCTSIEELAAAFSGFDVPGLSASAQRFNFLQAVPGARVLVIGDRPRTEEEQEGGVFAGKTALLLANMLKAIGLAPPGQTDPETVALANLVPWRPPGNRNPIDIEVAMCVPFATRAIALLKPQLILCLGALPGKWLAQAGESVAQQRGKWMEINTVPALSTFHPFELLNYPERKKLAWRDLQMFQDRMKSA
jgi:uracil-DNA glycosylase